jgi:hypothetical protein
MAIFGLYVEDNKELNRYVRDMNETLSEQNLYLNPFSGVIKKYKSGDKTFLFIYLRLGWINTTYPAMFTTVAWLFFYGLHINFLFYISLPLWFGAFLFTSIFTKLAVRFSLKKKGYKGKIKSMSDSDLLLGLANWESLK